MQFAIINQYNDFVALRDEWNSLIDSIPDGEIFYKHEWAKTFIEELAPQCKSELCVLIGRDNNKLELVFPFVESNGMIAFITSKTVDYNGVYIDNEFRNYKTIKEAVRFLIKQRATIKGFDLQNLRDSGLLYMLEDILRKNGFYCYIEESVVAPAIIKGTSASSFDKKQVKNTERCERRWNKEKEEINVITTDELTPELVNFVIDTRNKKHPGHTLSDEYKRFYKKLSTKEYLKSNMYINYIMYQGDVVAAHMGFIDDRKVYYYIPVYDEKYSSDSLGAILLNHIILDNIESREFDFLRGSEDYKYYYCNKIRMNFSLYANKTESSVTLRRFKDAMKRIDFLRKVFKKDL